MDTLRVTESLPPRLVAGDVLTRSVQTEQPNTSTFQLALTAIVNNTPNRYILGAAGSTIAIDSTGLALLQIASSVTSTWLPGRYDWVAVAIDGVGNRTTLAEGSTVIEPDPLGATAADTRSYNRRVLDQIRALRFGKALDDVSMYKVGGRELTHYTHAELARLEAEYEGRVRGEKIRKGQRVRTRNKGINFGGRR